MDKVDIKQKELSNKLFKIRLTHKDMVWIQQNIAEITNTRGKNKGKVDTDSF